MLRTRPAHNREGGSPTERARVMVLGDVADSQGWAGGGRRAARAGGGSKRAVGVSEGSEGGQGGKALPGPPQATGR